MKNDSPRVVIAVPLASPFIYWRTMAGLLEMERPFESDLLVFQGALVDRARNYLVEQMFEHPIAPTHIFFVDWDIVLPPNALLTLLGRKLPIVGGVYRRRLPPHEPMAFVRRKKQLQPISLKGPRLQSVDAVGGGCLLVEREVFEKVQAPWFVSEWKEEGHVSEDFYFCDKAKKKGYSVMVDTSVRPLHLDPMGIGTDKKNKVQFIAMD